MRSSHCGQPLSRMYPDPPPLVLAISGDETQHLLWRLETELSPALREDPNLSIVLMIGTNNIGNAHHPARDCVAGILQVARMLLLRTRGRLLLHALLPRGRDPKLKAKLKRYTTVMPTLHRVNQLVAATVDEDLMTSFPSRVRRVDCGPIFAGNGGEQEVRGLKAQPSPH